jgi:hypothetical protein
MADSGGLAGTWFTVSALWPTVWELPDPPHAASPKMAAPKSAVTTMTLLIDPPDYWYVNV